MAYKSTAAQQKIFDFVKNGTGNGIIDAVAGAGKTTTLMGCVLHIPNIDDVIYCAFNTSIRKELQEKFHAAKKNVKVCTIHSLGFDMLRATMDYKVNDRKYNEIIKDSTFFETLEPFVDRILGYHNHPTVAELKRLDEKRYSLDCEDKNTLNDGQQYVGKIMTRLLEINQKHRCTLEEDSVEGYDKMVRHFGIFDSFETEQNYYKDELRCYFNAHKKLLKEGNSMAVSHGIIDYTDMLYLPYVLNLSSKNKYGFVFVDECQDLSNAQLYVVKQYLREDGRLLAVGDPYQAIYGFAGADCLSFERVKNTFNCTPLTLTDCFRCPQAVIQLAKSIRSDINGFKQYSGKIYRIPEREVIYNAKEGDLIICRFRKPLMKMALRLIAKDFKVKIHPDELQGFIGNYKSFFTPQELRKILTQDRIDAFFEQARNRNEQRIIRETQNADSVIRNILIKKAVGEMEETLNFLKTKFFDWHLNTLQSILTRLEYTLSNPQSEAIKLSSIHRAKGLENDRVFILNYNKLPCKRTLEWECTQERNLHYVALTRSKEELYLCNEQLTTDGDENAVDNTQPAQPINEVYEAKPETAELIAPAATSDFIAPAGIAEEEVLKDNISDGQEALNDLIIPIKADHSSENKEYQENDFPHSEPKVANRPMFFIKLCPTQTISKIPSQFYSLEEVEDAPYPGLNSRQFQKAKFWSVYNNLQDTEFTINNVRSLQYRDDYYINTPNGIEIYNGHYNNSGQYTFQPQGKCVNAEQVMCYLTDESNYKIRFEYQPQNLGFEAVHEVIQATCKKLGICNTNIYQENYTWVYCFKTSCSYAYIKLMYNGKNIITTVSPYSTLGGNDDKLNSLLEILQHLWQE